MSHPRTLRSLGFTPAEERLYRYLLSVGSALLTELATYLDESEPSVKDLLNLLEEKGFVTRSNRQKRRYFAMPPDIAIAALFARRQQDAVALAYELSTITSRSALDGRVVEVISRDSVGRVIADFRRMAKTEMLCLERAPTLVTKLGEDEGDLFDCLKRGVRVRSLVDIELLKSKGKLENMRFCAEAGEQYRIRRSLPFKLLVVDRRIGIVPLDAHRPDGQVLMVRSSSLLEALCDMFDMLWSSASPFMVAREQSYAADSRAQELLPLLVAGLNDKSIGLELGMSDRTLARRIVELMERLGASTRFQAGWLAAQMARGDEEASSS